ncbi:MAG: 30S ribosomal protein S13, partial [Armatimonadota bacterium]
MARIAGVDLPRNRAIWYGLQSIFGIGPKTATDVLTAAGIDPRKKVIDL